jgi:hypothetical protein
MKNKQNYANYIQNLVFTTEFCYSDEVEKSEMIRMTTFWTLSVVVNSNTFQKLDLSPSHGTKVPTQIGLLIMDQFLPLDDEQVLSPKERDVWNSCVSVYDRKIVGKIRDNLFRSGRKRASFR